MEYKSQLGQDKWIVELFKGKKNGFFVDIGAFDGFHYNNTSCLEKELNWTGICVEPLPKVYQERSKRTCIFENLAISNKAGLVYFKQDGMGSMIVDKPGPDVVQVQTITIEELLRKHNAPTIIDYISIDTEGNELEIIQTFPFAKYAVRAWTIEHNAYTGLRWQQRRAELRKIMESNGHKFAKQVDCDDWYY